MFACFCVFICDIFTVINQKTAQLMDHKLLNLFFLIAINGFILGQGINIPLDCSNIEPEICASPKTDLRGLI
jgi:hypothetical protein